jgi:flagellar basal-body rod protein FlgB
MIDALFNDSTVRLLEQTMSFTEQRHNVLLADIANSDTPGYVQRDLPVAQFQQALREAVRRQRESLNDAYEPQSQDDLGFESGGSSVSADAVELPMSVPFHDRGVRSMEYLMSQLADNAQAHNMAAQFLKNRYDWISRAISMKV